MAKKIKDKKPVPVKKGRFSTCEKAMLALVAVFSAVMSYLSIIKFTRLGSFSQYYDLSIFEQSFWTTVHNGTFMFNSITGQSQFGIHNSPVLFSILPFYYLFPVPETLLVFQAVVIALAAIPLFYLARDILDERYALAIVCMYMVFPQLHGVILFEFHEVCFIPLFVFTALYFLYKKNIPVFVIILSASLLIKEDMALIVIPIFIYALYKKMYAVKYEQWLLIGGICLAALWMSLSLLVIIPSFNPDGVYTNSGRYDSSDITSMVTQYPVPKLTYLSSVFIPVLCIPFFSPGTMLAMLPALLEIMLQEGEFRFITSLHYVIQVIPLLFLSVILGFKRLQKYIHPENTGFLVMLVLVVLGISAMTSEVSPFSDRYYFNIPNPHIDVLNEGMSLVPDGSSLYVGGSFIRGTPHRMDMGAYYKPGMEYLFVDSKSGLFNNQVFSQYNLTEYDKIFDKQGVFVFHSKLFI